MGDHTHLARPAPGTHDRPPTLDASRDGKAGHLAGWIVAAVREHWEAAERLAKQRADEAWQRRWEQDAARREQAEASYRASTARSAAWCAVISDALDDDLLTDAVERVTTPVAGLDRRSVPVARAQLLAWAIAVQRSRPGRSLRWALAADLAAGPTNPTPLPAPLPDPTETTRRPDDLARRIAAVLDRRPDLAHPSPDQRTAVRAREAPCDRERRLARSLAR